MSDTPSDAKLKQAVLKYFHSGDVESRHMLETYIALRGLASFQEVAGPCIKNYIDTSYKDYKTANVVLLRP